MQHVIARIREKPERTRRAYGLSVAFSVTGIIALVWLSTLPARLDTANTQVAAPAAVERSVFVDVADTFTHGTQPLRDILEESR